jgi:hypothetical protein
MFAHVGAFTTPETPEALEVCCARNGLLFQDLLYYREVLKRAIGAVERLTRETRKNGELARDALARFPQLIAAPVALTFLWSVLFEGFAPLDRFALLGAYLDLVFRLLIDDPSYFCCLMRLPRRAVEYTSHFGGQLLTPVGLAEELDPDVEAAIMDDSVLGIPGSKQDLQRRNDLDGPLGELPATYRSWHHDIGE